MSAVNSLPDKWNVKPLGEACKTMKGKKPKDSGPASKERTVPYVNIKAFETGRPEEFAVPGDYPICERDDVLIVWDGARAGLTGRGVRGYIGSTLAKVYSDAADNNYLYYFLRAQFDHINSRTKGVGIPHVDPTIFNTIAFPIAPKNQQQRIVAEIEKQFSRLDEAVAALKRVKANLKRYKAAILKAAVGGGLTESWRKQHPDVEPASKLLERILAERRAKWNGKGKYKEPEAPNPIEFPPLTNRWTWATVEQLSLLVQYGSSAKTYEEAIGVPVLRMGNIKDGRLQLDSLKYLPKNHDEFPELFLREGDILFNRTNSAELVGKTAVYEGKPTPCSFASYLIRVRLAQGCAPDLLAYFINSVSGRTWIAQVVSQQVGQANVNGTKLQALAVPLPPLDEQGQIVAEVERRLSVIKELEVTVDANLTRADRLRQSILSHAFSGKLKFES